MSYLSMPIVDIYDLNLGFKFDLNPNQIDSNHYSGPLKPKFKFKK